MGSRSRGGSSNTSGQTQGTMNNLAKGRVSNSSMMDILDQLQNSQLGGILPILDVLMKNGNSTMASNPLIPMFGGQQQAPQQSLTDVFQEQQPQPQQEPQPPQAPQLGPMGQSGIGATPNITPEQMAAIQTMQGYGRR